MAARASPLFLPSSKFLRSLSLPPCYAGWYQCCIRAGFTTGFTRLTIWISLIPSKNFSLFLSTTTTHHYRRPSNFPYSAPNRLARLSESRATFEGARLLASFFLLARSNHPPRSLRISYATLGCTVAILICLSSSCFRVYFQSGAAHESLERDVEGSDSPASRSSIRV